MLEDSFDDDCFSFNSEYDAQFNVIVAGDHLVGKSYLVEKYVLGHIPSLPPTIGLEYYRFFHEFNGRRYKLQIWDLGGDIRFREICKSYFRGASGVLVVFAVTNKDSFDNALTQWMKIKEENCDKSDAVPVVIIGTKGDCCAEERGVSHERIRIVTDEMNLSYVETSSQTGVNVQVAFETLLREMIERNKSEYKQSYISPI